MPAFVPVHPPREPEQCPQWLFEAVQRLNRAATNSSQGLAAIVRNETPDGSGTTLVDLSQYFYLPGRSSGQLAYGATSSGGSLTLSSTSSSTKGKIYFDAGRSLMAFDEVTGYLGIGTVSPVALLNIYSTAATMARLEPGTFAVTNCTIAGDGVSVTVGGGGSFTPVGGPCVVAGMYVLGTGATSTQVLGVTSSTSLTLTSAGTPGSGITLTFRTYLDILPINDETGRDLVFNVAGAIRFQTGTQTDSPLRIRGETAAISPNSPLTSRVFLEVGTVASTIAYGTDLQIGGPNPSGAHGDLRQLNLFSVYTNFDCPKSGGAPQLGISMNPTEYTVDGSTPRTGNGASLTVLSRKNHAIIAMLDSGLSASRIILGAMKSEAAAVSNVSPLKGMDFNQYYFKVTGDGIIHFGTGGTGGNHGVWFNFGDDNFNVMSEQNGLLSPNVPTVMIGTGTYAPLWSDSGSVKSRYFWFGDFQNVSGSLNELYATFSSRGFALFSRLNLAAKYTMIGNAAPGTSEALAPSSASPEVLQIINAPTNGTDATVLFKVRTLRSGQIGNLTEWVDSSNRTLAYHDSAGALHGDYATLSYEDDAVWYEDDLVWY